MEEIFANPGYNIIKLKILKLLDTASMVNLTKVSKTVCFNMKSIKTCQIYFTKCIEVLPQTTRLGISTFSTHSEIKTKFQNDLEIHELIALFNYLCQLGENVEEQHLKQGTQRALQRLGGQNNVSLNDVTPWPDFNPQHFTNLSQNIQSKIKPIWDLFQSLNKMDQLINPLPLQGQLERNVRFEEIKTKLVAAFKCLQRCPLILAMEMNQDNLAKFLLNSNMLYICNCAKLTSMISHSVALYHCGIISYLQSRRGILPRRLDLDAACYGSNQLQHMIQTEDKIQQFQDLGMPNSILNSVRNGARDGYFNNMQPFANNNQAAMPFPVLPNPNNQNLGMHNLLGAFNNQQAAIPFPAMPNLNNLLGAMNNHQQAAMPFPGLPINLIGAMNNHQLQALAAMPFPGLQNNPNSIGAANNQQAAMPFPGLPNNQIGAMNNHFQALAGMPFPGLPNYPNPIVAAINQQAAMPFPGLPNNLIGAMNNHQVQALAAMPFPGLPNNFNALINNQIQVPNATPNNPAGPVNNQAQQAAGPNLGMPSNPAGGINNQQPQALQNPGAANAANGANDNQPLIEPDLE